MSIINWFKRYANSAAEDAAPGCPKFYDVPERPLTLEEKLKKAEENVEAMRVASEAIPPRKFVSVLCDLIATRKVDGGRNSLAKMTRCQFDRWVFSELNAELKRKEHKSSIGPKFFGWDWTVAVAGISSRLNYQEERMANAAVDSYLTANEEDKAEHARAVAAIEALAQ